MGHLTNAVCFTCGLAIESPPRLSRLTNGQVCPACRERVLEGLPPALPSRAREPHGAAEAFESDERDSLPRQDGWDSAT
jgi:DNA-directed RNA polymerase subunit RPC12/RpoP